MTLGALFFGAWCRWGRSWGWLNGTMALWWICSACAAGGALTEIPLVIISGLPRGVGLRALFFGKILWVVIFCVAAWALHYEYLILPLAVVAVPMATVFWIIILVDS